MSTATEIERRNSGQPSGSPLPASKTGAGIIVDALLREGVDTVFGYPGAAVIPLYNVLYDTPEIRVILTRHEQAAAHAADGYARATGRTGVCVATSGPGATNLVTGIATAFMDSIPLIALTGQVATPHLGTDAFQEVDIAGITRPVTKHNYLVQSVADLPGVLREAFHIAHTGRPGPVLVDIPVDVARAVLDEYEYPERVSVRGYRPTFSGNIRQIQRAAEVIAQARRPYIYAGGGVIHAGAHSALRELAERINAPVTTTLMGLGAFPGTHPLFTGMPGMHGSKAANFAFQNADLIIAVGARFDDRVTGHVGSFAPNAAIIHLDVDPASISKTIKVDVPVVGDARDILDKLNGLVKPRQPDEWNRMVDGWKNGRLFSYADSTDTIKPQRVIETLFEITRGEAIVATDVGQHQMWTAQYYRFCRPRQLLTSGGLGTMGFGLPAAMGAALAHPDRQVVAISGDGSIQMNIQELATISLNNIPAKVVILNNGYLGMVRQWQQLFYDGRYSSTCLREAGGRCRKGPECDGPYVPDFVALARAYGIAGFRAAHPRQVAQVLEQGLAAPGPAVMEFIVDREENVFPMVPAGKPIDLSMEE